jgi:hypothetical protein
MTNRQALLENDEIEVTPEMIEAAEFASAKFNPEFDTWETGALTIIQAALIASGYRRR